MKTDTYCYTFAPDVSLEEVEASLLLALFGVESLHGESQTRLDAGHDFDREARTCVIDASTEVGRDLNKLFVGFLRREFGEDSFAIDRVAPKRRHAPETTIA